MTVGCSEVVQTTANTFDYEPLPVAQDLGPHIDSGTMPDASPDDAEVMPVLECEQDNECPPGMYCTAVDRCTMAVESLFFEAMTDGVTRAGAASFELLPDYLEVWQDAAGLECPANRLGRFDGRLDVSKPEDPCLDSFEDADNDGSFDAVWLGGWETDRPATGIDENNPPQGRVVLLYREDVIQLLVTLDVFSLSSARVDALRKSLALRLGLQAEQISVHATGVRTGPDALGLSGPSLLTAADSQGLGFEMLARGQLGLLQGLPLKGGVDEGWWRVLMTRIAAAVRQAATRLEPIRVRHALEPLPFESPTAMSGAIEFVDVDEDGRLNDTEDIGAWRTSTRLLAADNHLPAQADNDIWVVSFDDAETMVSRIIFLGWGAAPTASLDTEGLLSGDIAGESRRQIEERLPGVTAIWLGTAASDTYRAGWQSFMPAVDDDGFMLGQDGQKVDSIDDAVAAPDPIPAVGRLLSRLVLQGLDSAPSYPAMLHVEGRYVWIPIENPRLVLAARLGLLPLLGDWLLGRTITDQWVDGFDAPPCGGFGCLRYRLDRISLTDEFSMVTTPGAIDHAYISGRPSSSIAYGDQRSLMDLDGDGVLDSEDSEIRIRTTIGSHQLSFALSSPANPQSFDAIEGLERSVTWLVGRTNGGVGSMRSSGSEINVFEGTMDELQAFAERPENSGINLCGLGYPCQGEIGLELLVDLVVDAHAERLADIAVSHQAHCLPALPEWEWPTNWRIEDSQGDVVASGNDLVLGPGDEIYTQSVDLFRAGVQAGDLLYLPEISDEVWVITEMDITTLRWHPNAGDSWYGISTGAGDFVYNTACELIYGGVCPHARSVGIDPNRQLPRRP